MAERSAGTATSKSNGMKGNSQLHDTGKQVVQRNDKAQVDDTSSATSGPETRQYNVAQIYVQSEDHAEDFEQKDVDITDQTPNTLRQDFSLPDDMNNSMEDVKQETSDMESPIAELTYRSICHYYRQQLANDITSCRRVPNFLLEIIASMISIANIIIAYAAFHEITYETTGVRYRDFMHDHDKTMKPYSSGMNYKTIHIYREAVFLSWRTFIYLGLSLIIFEIFSPLLRVIIIADRAPKKVNTLHSLVQISLLACLALEDGAISLCKNMLFAEECGIRQPMMSTLSQTSAAITFVNTMMKTTLFLWRSSYRTQRAVRDEMEAYTEILILEEYQWYHCIIPILTHIAVICITIWSLVDATNKKLLCEEEY